jgi:hypothetical protein
MKAALSLNGNGGIAVGVSSSYSMAWRNNQWQSK